MSGHKQTCKTNGSNDGKWISDTRDQWVAQLSKCNEWLLRTLRSVTLARSASFDFILARVFTFFYELHLSKSQQVGWIGMLSLIRYNVEILYYVYKSKFYRFTRWKWGKNTLIGLNIYRDTEQYILGHVSNAYYLDKFL